LIYKSFRPQAGTAERRLPEVQVAQEFQLAQVISPLFLRLFQEIRLSKPLAGANLILHLPDVLNYQATKYFSLFSMATYQAIPKMFWLDSSTGSFSKPAHKVIQ
jgi:hypothetical protein